MHCTTTPLLPLKVRLLSPISPPTPVPPLHTTPVQNRPASRLDTITGRARNRAACLDDNGVLKKRVMKWRKNGIERGVSWDMLSTNDPSPSLFNDPFAP